MINLEIFGHVAVITLQRPEARNAITPEMSELIEACIDRLEEDPELRVGVLAAEGPVFCAGADLKTVSEGRALEIPTERGGFAGLVFRDRSKPIIAAIEGLAVAGGCEIAAACDLVVASRATHFGLPEVKRSLVAAAGGLMRLPNIVGTTVAMEIALTGEPISAQRAYELGLVNRLAEPGDVLRVAMEVAEVIASNAPIAVRESRALVLAARLYDEPTLRSLTEAAVLRNLSTEDAQEGPRSFLEKRSPVWHGR